MFSHYWPALFIHEEKTDFQYTLEMMVTYK